MYRALSSSSIRVPWGRSHSTTSSESTRGWFFCVSRKTSRTCAVSSSSTFEVIRAGRAVVRLAYSTAAEIPIPCCPRACRWEWNREP